MKLQKLMLHSMCMQTGLREIRALLSRLKTGCDPIDRAYGLTKAEALIIKSLTDSLVPWLPTAPSFSSARRAIMLSTLQSMVRLYCGMVC